MARQIGTTLKKVQLRKDLHTVLAKSVAEAREAMGIGPRPGEASGLTPIVDLTPSETQKVAHLRPDAQEKRGLRHRLPTFFGFGRKRG